MDRVDLNCMVSSYVVVFFFVTSVFVLPLADTMDTSSVTYRSYHALRCIALCMQEDQKVSRADPIGVNSFVVILCESCWGSIMLEQVGCAAETDRITLD